MTPCRRLRDTYRIVGSLGTFAAAYLTEIAREAVALRTRRIARHLGVR